MHTSVKFFWGGGGGGGVGYSIAFNHYSLLYIHVETENLVDLKVKERTSSDSSKKPTAGVQSQAVHTLPERGTGE